MNLQIFIPSMWFILLTSIVFSGGETLKEKIDLWIFINTVVIGLFMAVAIPIYVYFMWIYK